MEARAAVVDDTRAGTELASGLRRTFCLRLGLGLGPLLALLEKLRRGCVIGLTRGEYWDLVYG